MRLNYIDNIDCLEGLKDIPDKSVDLIVTDPPYFLSMGHAGDKENAKSLGLSSNRTFNDLAICKPFYSQLFQEYRRVLKDDGSFYFFTDWRMAAFSSGAKSTNGKKVHPTQKPWELIAKAIEDATEPGAVVLDTFMGSGTTAVACLKTGRNYIGFELDEKYHAIAMQRIAEETPAVPEAKDDEEAWMA